MLTYEVTCEFNGTTTTRLVVARSDEDAIARVRDEWSLDGDEPPPASAFWVSARWSRS